MSRPIPPLRSVLVLCRAYLGDQLLSAPIFRNLRAWAPDARITAASFAEQLEVLSLFPEVDEVMAIPRGGRGRGGGFLGEYARTVRRIRTARFDLVYDLMDTDRSALLTALSGARLKVSYVKDKYRLRHRVYDHLSRWEEDLGHRHTVELYLKALAELGMPVRTLGTELRVPGAAAEAARAIVARVFPNAAGPLVLVHPGASTPNRLWPAERFAAVCDDLRARHGARLLLLGGPREAELLAAIRAGMAEPAPVLEERVSVVELAALLREADLFLGLDSGPMHLAAAVGTPVVALFGAALPSLWGPRGEGHTLLRPEIPCEPCACPGVCRPPNPYHMFCVRRIAAAEVSEAAARRLAEVGRGG